MAILILAVVCLVPAFGVGWFNPPPDPSREGTGAMKENMPRETKEDRAPETLRCPISEPVRDPVVNVKVVEKGIPS